jgi:hypothetical protein
MVEGEETQRAIFGSHGPENPEAKAFVTLNPKPSLRAEARGDPTTKCDYCKIEGHRRDGC